MGTLREPHLSENSADDAAIVARVLAGDKQQFGMLVVRYQVALYRYAVSLVLDHDTAADMVQDAFVRAYINLRTCRDHDRFRAWLFQTLRHRCLDHLKEASRKNIPLEQAGPIADGAEGPADRMERAGLRQEIKRALATLSDSQREAFLMHYVEGLSYEAMAELLDASVSALKMRVMRAREALVSAIQDAEVTERAPVRLSVRGG
jgi:RNA polymerase sigma-70 factor (ECF subfamily)